MAALMMSAAVSSPARLSSRRTVAARRPGAAQAARRAVQVQAVTKKTTSPPAKRFGAKQPAAEEAKPVALVCGQCGYIYTNSKPFSAQPSSYKCPVCKAPKAAFEEKDVGGVTALLPVAASLLAVLAAAGVYLSKL